MSDVDDTISTEVVETPEVSVEVPPKSEQEFGHVEFQDPAVQKRFNRMYAQVKEQERLQAKLAEDNKKLLEKLEAIENAGKQNEVASSIDKLKAARKQAWLEGNVDLADELDEKIYELRELKKQDKKVVTPAPTEPEVNIPVGLQHRVMDWVAETNDTGELLRPYAHPNHPKYKQFEGIVAGIMADEDLRNTVLSSDPDAPEVTRVFEMVDKAMEELGVKRRHTKVQPSVLSPSVKQGTKSEPAKLTPDEIAVAKKMYRGDPDPIARYRKAKATMDRPIS